MKNFKLIVVSHRNCCRHPHLPFIPFWRTVQLLLRPPKFHPFLHRPTSALPFGLATVLGEGGQETYAVRVVVEDLLTAVSAIDDVIDRTGIFEAQLAGHEEDDEFDLKDLTRFDEAALSL